MKFVNLVDGILKQISAITSSAGGTDANKIIALDGSGKLDSSFMPNGVGANTVVAEASETLAAGDLVNLWNDGGTLKVRKADGSTTGKFVSGFVSAAVTSGSNATVYDTGTISGLSGLTLDNNYFLSTTGGGVTTTAPSASGQTVQLVGQAISATELLFQKGTFYEID